MKKLTPIEFTNAFYPFAKQTEEKTGISAIAILAQAALESGWGERAVGNAFFGVKDTDGVNGNEQLLVTTEYLKTATAKFPVILKVIKFSKTLWKYTVKDYFRKYRTPEECFTEHGNFFLKNKRYAKALEVKHDYNLFFIEIEKAGYATAVDANGQPNYAKTLSSIARMIVKCLPDKA